jgi:hypothetical protein
MWGYLTHNSGDTVTLATKKLKKNSGFTPALLIFFVAPALKNKNYQVPALSNETSSTLHQEALFRAQFEGRKFRVFLRKPYLQNYYPQTTK